MSSPSSVVIRRLDAGDAAALATLRRRALETAPSAFESGPGDDRLADPAFVLTLLEDPRQAVFGAFAEDALVGFAGVMPGTHRKTVHRMDLWGLFVDMDYRRRGLARSLVEAALAFAHSVDWVTTVHLSVTERAPEAAALYRSLGFETWGLEPDAIRVGGVSLSEAHMVLHVI